MHGPPPSAALARRLANALTIDVEDYFQVSAFEHAVSRSAWDSLPGRVEANTDRTLELLGRHGARATFFTLGWVARRHPELVRRIAEAGHEVASHGMDHVRATAQDRETFRRDAADSRRLLEDVAGVPVAGYRAPSFSIARANLWALDVLGEVGYRYSSSVYPGRTDHYGLPGAPRFAFRCASSGLLEVPISTLELAGRRLPCAGGGYFRLLPYRYFRWAIRRINREERQPAVFYFHPWELDPDQPRMPGLRPLARLRHYTNLRRMEHRLERLLAEFRWTRMDELFLGAAIRAPARDLARLTSGR